MSWIWIRIRISPYGSGSDCYNTEGISESGSHHSLSVGSRRFSLFCFPSFTSSPLLMFFSPEGSVKGFFWGEGRPCTEMYLHLQDYTCTVLNTFMTILWGYNVKDRPPILPRRTTFFVIIFPVVFGIRLWRGWYPAYYAIFRHGSGLSKSFALFAQLRLGNTAVYFHQPLLST